MRRTGSRWELTQDNRAATTALCVRLQSENLGNPRPGLLHMLWAAAANPSVSGNAIDLSHITYRPWRTGSRCAYGHLFEGTSQTIW